MRFGLNDLLTGAMAVGFISLAAPAVQAAPAAPFLAFGEQADAPEGFTEMCARDQALCHSALPGTLAAQAPRVPEPRFQPAPNFQSAPSFKPASGFQFAKMIVLTPLPFLEPESARPANAISFGPGLPFGGPPALDGSFYDWAFRRAPWSSLDQTLRQPVIEPAIQTGSPATAQPTPLTRDEARLVRKINRKVNQTTRQVSDMTSAGVEERWNRLTPGRGAMGDCEDIAIEKRMRLVEAGFDPQRLFYAVVYKSGFGLHTVLIVRMDDADYVLDSASPHILRWSQTKYVWLRAQSTSDAMLWRKIETQTPSVLVHSDTPDDQAREEPRKVA